MATLLEGMSPKHIAPPNTGSTLTEINASTLSLTLPKWQLLRLQISAPNLPELWVGQSRGLYLKHKWGLTSDPATFVFGDIDSHNQEVLLRFPRAIPLDILHTLTLGRTGPSRRAATNYPLAGKTERINGQEYWHLNAGEAQSISLPDAGEIMITTQPELSSQATAEQTSYRLSSRWNQSDSSHYIFSGGNTTIRDPYSCPQVSPRQNRLMLTPPKSGSNTLHLSSDQDLLLRVSAITDAPYLFAINAPAQTSGPVKRPSDALHKLDLSQPGLHDWGHRERELYQQSLSLIGNTYRNGALAAIELLDNRLEANPSDHIQALRNTLWARVTHYRDLRPNKSTQSLRLRFSDINLPARAVSLASAEFHLAPEVSAYQLPGGRYRKHFRLALTPLDTFAANQPNERFARLQASTQYGETLNFLLDLSTNTDTPLPPGLALMDKGQFRSAASSTVFTLPGNSEQLTVKQLSGPPLALALQVRDGNAFRLSEREFMTVVNEDPDAAFKVFTSGIKTPSKIYPGADDTLHTRLLKAHLRPLWLRLETQRARFIEDLDPARLSLKNIGTQKSLRHIETLIQKSNWDQLVYASHPLGSSKNTHIRHTAIAARHLALSKLGEHRTARHFLKLALSDPDESLRHWVTETLVEAYSHNQQYGRITGLYTELLRKQEDVQYLRPLIQSLSVDGREQEALTLALLMPALDPERTAGLALGRQWQKAFESTLTHMPPIRQRHWLALGALQSGEFDSASDHWRDAAMPQEAARAKLGAGQLALLSAPSHSSHGDTWFKWLRSFDSAQPDYRRRPVPQNLISGLSSDVINHVSENRTRYYQVGPGSQVTLRIQGPLTLQVSTRGVFDDPGDIDYSGWLNIRNGAQTIYFPLLKLAADNASNELGQTVSTPSSTRLQLGAGLHQLRFDADKALLIRLQMEQSNIVSGVLPEPQTATLWGNTEPVAQASTLRYHWLDRYRQQPACHPQYSGQGYPLRQLFDPEQRFSVARASVLSTPLNGFSEAQKEERAQALLSTQELHKLSLNPETLTPEMAYPMALSALWYRDHDIIPSSLAALYIAVTRQYGGENRRIAAFYADISRQYRWQLLDNVRDSAGIRKFEQFGALPGSATSRELFLKNAPKDLNRLLDARTKLSFNYDTLVPTQLKLGLQQLVLPGTSTDSVSVELNIDGSVSKSIRLSGSGRKRGYTLNFKPGPHQITFRVIADDPKTRIALSLAEQKEQGFSPLESGVQRAYFVADANTKIRIDAHTPALYRIDKRVNDRITSHYRPMIAGSKPIVLDAKLKDAAYFRIYEFIETPLSSSSTSKSIGLISAQPLPDSPELALNWFGDIDGYILADYATTDYRHDLNRGTWGFGIQTGESRQSDEEGSGGITPLYTQTVLSYRRHFEQLNAYSRTELLSRDYTDQLDTMTGIRQWFDWYSENSDWHVGTYGHYYRQDARERKGKASNDAVLVRLEADYSFDITRSLRNKVKLQAFQSWLSLQENDLAPGAAVDPSIFSPYKDDHPKGWNFSDRLTFNYWRDNRIYIEAALRSNSLQDPADLDAYGVKIGLDQIYDQLTFGSNFHYRWYKNDSDRRQDSETRRLKFYLDWNRWRDSHGLQLGSDVSLDFDTGLHTWNAHLNWYFNSGNLQNFRPGELKFRSLQNRRFESETDISPVWYK